MKGKWQAVRSDADLTNERGSHRDYREFRNKGSCSRKEIDWMVDRLEALIPQLRQQDQIDRLTGAENGAVR